MSAWHGEAGLKAATLERLREHRRLDELVQGTYWQEGRGCQLGCLTHAHRNHHSEAQRLFGIEERVGRWLEAVFENLPANECGEWVLASCEAIPVGADMSKCHHHLAIWLLGPDSPSAKGNAHPKVADSVAAVRELHEQALIREVPLAAWSAAWSARSAAWAAIASKSLEIFRAAPVQQDSAIDSCVREELCAKRLWCPDGAAY